ncbi:uncharacterized protein B0I36DRAFT_435776 [Microdochium trichocladiopsis]|uniref:Uncharacterized protein n=1 Tax=Microdochium trichocladiopsis TaxID=1682393 RepID=A0A9P8XXU4_9PEZI|nr:uncharacterized protein B0I36DRAFT_435776 [Microdochium trichocladiopsis]KAH7018477.1 hypothetical protein B0I36DRAFT_435776 [Microdochium trichocladiopsis]
MGIPGLWQHKQGASIATTCALHFSPGACGAGGTPPTSSSRQFHQRRPPVEASAELRVLVGSPLSQRRPKAPSNILGRFAVGQAGHPCVQARLKPPSQTSWHCRSQLLRVQATQIKAMPHCQGLLASEL